MRFPLGGILKDFDSKKSRAEIVNLIPELDEKGNYRTVKRVDGLTAFATLSDGPVRSNLLVNAGYVYVVSGSSLHRVDALGVATSLGAVGGSGRAVIRANSVPGDSQILVLNGSGLGYIYTNAAGLVQITDVDFNSSTSATILKERFWFARDDTNEFFGSAISDGTTYSALTYGSADESPDDVVAVQAKKSALWVLGEKTTQYFQDFNDPDFPLRDVRGATKEWGIIAKDSLSEVNEAFAFLADDRTVRLIQGTQITEISDLSFRIAIKGNGTLTEPGFSKIDDAYGFFVDGPIHSIYYITFPTEGYTWGFDVKTGVSHRRESEGLGYWRVNSAVKFGNKIICGDSEDGKLWVLDPDSKTEGDQFIRTKIVTPSISFPKDTYIDTIEIDMEVAQTNDPTIDPMMIVYYTKDGGNTWINKGHVPIGKYGQHSKRVPLRQFGRLVRHKDFALRLETTDDIGNRYYGAEMRISESI